MTEADTRLCTALSSAKLHAPEIAALLHSAYHDGHCLPEGRVEERIRDARERAEKLLVAILAAEQAMMREVA
jgi:hypothetical protein